MYQGMYQIVYQSICWAKVICATERSPELLFSKRDQSVVPHALGPGLLPIAPMVRATDFIPVSGIRCRLQRRTRCSLKIKPITSLCWP